jgi:hypothetical protein
MAALAKPTINLVSGQIIFTVMVFDAYSKEPYPV